MEIIVAATVLGALRSHLNSNLSMPPPSNDTSLELPKWLRRVAVGSLALYWAALFVATHVPSPWDEPSGPSGQGDKLEHFVAYAGLGFLLVWSMLAVWSRLRPRWAFAIAVVYGAVDELLQGLVPTRVPDVWDLLADAMGALIGVALAVLMVRVVRKRFGGRVPSQEIAVTSTPASPPSPEISS